MPQEYKIPSAAVVYQEDIKKSKFIVHIAHTPDLESAKAFTVSYTHLTLPTIYSV